MNATTSACVNGTCYTYKNTDVCICNPGYDGPNCNITTTGCNNSSSCLNGGFCLIFNYALNNSQIGECICQNGFIGSSCEYAGKSYLNPTSYKQNLYSLYHE